MPNLISRLARYILRSRKRSALLQSPSTVHHSSSNTLSSTRSEDRVEKNGENTPETFKEKSTREAKPVASSNDEISPTESEMNSDDSKMRTVVLKMSNEIQQSSTVRNRRVLRELRNIMKATEQPDSAFQVSLVDENNIFEWDVKLLKVDETSDLWRSMQQTNTESINFRLTFPELFPFQPPFLRLVGPYLDNGFIMDGGAICMEVLTAQGWSSAYTIESLLVQVASGLTQGGAVVSRRQKRRYNRLTQRRAEIEFRRICKIHAKYGWVSMERDDL